MDEHQSTPLPELARLNVAAVDDSPRADATPADDAPPPDSARVGVAPQSTAPANNPWRHIGREIAAGLQTLVSAAVYATLIVTFGFQVARVDGLSMAPTLEDHDRLLVNKLVYELGEPRPGDTVMLYYPINPENRSVTRGIPKEGDTVG